MLDIRGDVSDFYIIHHPIGGRLHLHSGKRRALGQLLKNLGSNKHRWIYRQNGDSILIGLEAEVGWAIERKVFN